MSPFDTNSLVHFFFSGKQSPLGVIVEVDIVHRTLVIFGPGLWGTFIFCGRQGGAELQQPLGYYCCIKYLLVSTPCRMLRTGIVSSVHP